MSEISQNRCYVLGLETQIGLSLVRELGAAGVTVIGIAQSDSAIGLASRYLSESVRIQQPRTAEGLTELRTIGERFGPGTLIAVSEANLQWLMDAPPGSLGQLAPALPAKEAFAIVLDKTRTLEAARSVGIDVPETFAPQGWSDVLACAARCRFPAVLKWPDPAKVVARLAAQGLSLEKAEYVNSVDELLAACERYTRVGAWPVIQEYCPGFGLGQFFFMHKGQAIRTFQHQRVAEWPPEGGFSSVSDALPLALHRGLQSRSIALLQRIGWSGVAMVEYRHDPVTGRSVLMEINGRFWGSYPLAMHAGAGFALLTHTALRDAAMPALLPARERLRARMVTTELKRLVRIVLQPGKIHDRQFKRRPLAEIVRFIADYLRPSVCYYVWSWRDPMPFFRDVRNMLRRQR